uniref:Sulfhydryl oxidase n=1 Tax=Clastoptera arizonana TaxID=38151 RepID=A0A1B6DEV1_9HEMI
MYSKNSLLFCCYLLILTVTEQKSISPDSKKLYHDIVSGHGLYYGFDKFEELSSLNFKTVVYNKNATFLWLVEFYNSWCGHCHKFAPIWKGLAADIYGWRDVVALSAVDCSQEENNQLCRDIEIMQYPMIKVFPPHSSETNIGTDLKLGDISTIRHNIIKQVEALQGNQMIPGINLNPYGGNILEDLWTNVSTKVIYLVVVIEPNNSFVGSELALDFSRAKEIQISLVKDKNKGFINSLTHNSVNYDPQSVVNLYVLDRNSEIQRLQPENLNRSTLITTVKDYFANKGIDLAADLPSTDISGGDDIDIVDIMRVMQMEDEIKKMLKTKQLSTVVFQLDLEGALIYSLKREIPLHKNISGEMLTALKNYLQVLIKYFPIGKKGTTLFRRLLTGTVGNNSKVEGKMFKKDVNAIESELYPVFLPNQSWLGCRGSKEEYRGYPCGLWTVFHTLTVFAENKNKVNSLKGTEVLDAMVGYIKHFFTCSDCSQHFQQMALTIAGNVTTYNDSILWLWAAHNQANARLAGDPTEDPKHKKIQFPSSEACPQCRDDQGKFLPDNVLQFLKSMYLNVSYLQVSDVPTTPGEEEVKYANNLRHENIGQVKGFEDQLLSTSQSKRLSWDFNIFDISLCVFLYICSVAILVVVCVKFVFRRSYRKKTYIYDIFSKV